MKKDKLENVKVADRFSLEILLSNLRNKDLGNISITENSLEARSEPIDIVVRPIHDDKYSKQMTCVLLSSALDSLKEQGAKVKGRPYNAYSVDFLGTKFNIYCIYVPKSKRELQMVEI